MGRLVNQVEPDVKTVIREFLGRNTPSPQMLQQQTIPNMVPNGAPQELLERSKEGIVEYLIRFKSLLSGHDQSHYELNGQHGYSMQQKTYQQPQQTYQYQQEQNQQEKYHQPLPQYQQQPAHRDHQI